MSVAASDGAWLLEARGVTRRFGGLVAVDAVDLAVRRGSVHGLIGPNGAGKTTLLNLVAGVYRTSSGVLRFCGRDITRHSTASRARAGRSRSTQLPRGASATFPSLPLSAVMPYPSKRQTVIGGSNAGV